jgi:hypothetical protein
VVESRCELDLDDFDLDLDLDGGEGLFLGAISLILAPSEYALPCGTCPSGPTLSMPYGSPGPAGMGGGGGICEVGYMPGPEG